MFFGCEGEVSIRSYAMRPSRADMDGVDRIPTGGEPVSIRSYAMRPSRADHPLLPDTSPTGVSIRSYAMRPSRGDRLGRRHRPVYLGFNSLVCDEALARPPGRDRLGRRRFNSLVCDEALASRGGGGGGQPSGFQFARMR